MLPAFNICNNSAAAAAAVAAVKRNAMEMSFCSAVISAAPPSGDSLSITDVVLAANLALLLLQGELCVWNLFLLPEECVLTGETTSCQQSRARRWKA